MIIYKQILPITFILYSHFFTIRVCPAVWKFTKNIYNCTYAIKKLSYALHCKKSGVNVDFYAKS